MWGRVWEWIGGVEEAEAEGTGVCGRVQPWRRRASRCARPGRAAPRAGGARPRGAQSRARLAAGSELLRLLSPFFFFFPKSLSSQV